MFDSSCYKEIKSPELPIGFTLSQKTEKRMTQKKEVTRLTLYIVILGSSEMLGARIYCRRVTPCKITSHDDF